MEGHRAWSGPLAAGSKALRQGSGDWDSSNQKWPSTAQVCVDSVLLRCAVVKCVISLGHTLTQSQRKKLPFTAAAFFKDGTPIKSSSSQTGALTGAFCIVSHRGEQMGGAENVRFSTWPTLLLQD